MNKGLKLISLDQSCDIHKYKLASMSVMKLEIKLVFLC